MSLLVALPVRMTERREKTASTRKKARQRRKKVLDLTKNECCCDLKSKKNLKNIAKKPARLRELPEEIVLKIAEYLSLKDLLVFGQVCVTFVNCLFFL